MQPWMRRMIAAIRQLHQAANLLARMLWACWPLWLASGLLWVVQAYVGQGTELLRVAFGQLHQHLFFTLATSLIGLGLGSAAWVLTRHEQPPLADADAARHLAFVRHGAPTWIGLAAVMAPLLPVFDQTIDAMGLLAPALQVLPALDPVLHAPGMAESLGPMERTWLRFPMAAAVGAVLASRFLEGQKVHGRLGLYAAPAVLFLFSSLPVTWFVALQLGTVVGLDAWFAARRRILAPTPLPVQAAWALGVPVLLALPLWWNTAFWGLFTGPLAGLWVAMGLAVAALLAWRALPDWMRLVLLAAAVPLVAQSDIASRPVRTVADPDQAHALPMQDHVPAWIQARADVIRSWPGRYPVFFVTADGGGIRAAYWTASVLAALSDRHPSLPEHVFVVSGVSGGSVGATVYAALVSHGDTHRKGGLLAPARAALGQDFVAAPVGHLLWREPQASLFCLGQWQPWRCDREAYDRAVALEKLVEGAFRVATGADTLSEPLLSLWQGPRALTVPSLALNASVNGTGAHRVVPNLRPPTHDRFLGEGLRASTAAVLSARFPVISPNGAVKVDGRDEELVDGGYADNSGAAGATLVFQSFMQAVPADLKDKLLPVALVITNDPDAREGHPQRADPARAAADACPAHVEPSRPMPAKLLMTPLGTLDGQRQQAAESWRRGFMALVQGPQGRGEVIRVGLFRCARDLPFPLGWTLSPQVREQIDRKLRAFEASSAFGRVAQLMQPADTALAARRR